MEEEFPLLYHVALNIGLPILTLFMGWFGQAWKSKAQKKADDLDNTQQIITMQRDYIAEQQKTLVAVNKTNAEMQAKLDRKNKSIRQANSCKYTNRDGGCPVLIHEEKSDMDRCETCKFNTEIDNANGED